MMTPYLPWRPSIRRQSLDYRPSVTYSMVPNHRPVTLPDVIPLAPWRSPVRIALTTLLPSPLRVPIPRPAPSSSLVHTCLRPFVATGPPTHHLRMVLICTVLHRHALHLHRYRLPLPRYLPMLRMPTLSQHPLWLLLLPLADLGSNN